MNISMHAVLCETHSGLIINVNHGMFKIGPIEKYAFSLLISLHIVVIIEMIAG